MKLEAFPRTVKSAFAILLWSALAHPACLADEPLGARAVRAPAPVVTHKEVLDEADSAKFKIRIDLRTASLKLLADGAVALESPICSGRRTRPTSEGEFKVASKSESLKPEKYGRIVDSKGHTIGAVAYTDLDPVPPDCKFELSEQRYVLALGKDAPLIHAGTVSPVPCSDGSVIVPEPVARLLFARVPAGCPVEIVTSEEPSDEPADPPAE